MAGRATKKQTPDVVHVERRLVYQQFGSYNQPGLKDWDPKQVQLVEALLQVLSDGATLMIRPGSGNRSIGIAIWEGENRWPPTWCYDAEEVDSWAENVLRVHEAQAAD